MRDSVETLSRTTLALHWIVAISVISLIGVGWYMEEKEAYALYPIHKSFGMIIFLFIVWRVVWRTKNGWPEPVAPLQPLQHMLARAVHWVLILGTLLFPISGMMMSGAGGHGLAIFGLELLSANYDQATGEAVPLSAAAAELGSTLHGALKWIILGAILLHVAGALWHHYVHGDRTLRRMLGRAG